MSEVAFLRLLSAADKDSTLLEAVEALRRGDRCSNVFGVDSMSLQQVPGSPFAYWVSNNVRRLFATLLPFESDHREVRLGDHPSDDFRYLRLSWEVPFGSRSQDWRPYQKGGSFSPFYSDIHLVVDWDDDRHTYRGFYGRVGRSSERPSNYQYFFRPGLTWPRRSQRGLSLRVLPAGCVIGDKGPAVFAPDADLPVLLALANSAPFRLLVSLQMAFGSYEVGVIQRTPVPHFASNGSDLGHLALSCVALKQSIDTAEETSHIFTRPSLLQVTGSTLSRRAEAWNQGFVEAGNKLATYQRQIDDISYALYGIGMEDRLDNEPSRTALEPGVASDSGTDDEDESTTQPRSPDLAALVVDVLSYAIGAAFGRWDVRLAMGEHSALELPDPFAPLPACSPGMLTGDDGLPQREVPLGYPLSIDEDGILPDDPDHAEDIVRRVREVLELLWPNNADAIEAEACSLLALKGPRDYFRNPAKGFFDAHIKRYSRSRRKAPIYWLLQSPRKLYGLWVYYHRLDGDLLFKALTNYTEPKIIRERNRLEDLRAGRSAAGSGGVAAKNTERAIERQEVLLADLREFRDKLAAAAQLGLEPDLNDGVLLTIAPLREIVPWKEARTTWDELVSGKYGWSSIGQQMQAKGLARPRTGRKEA